MSFPNSTIFDSVFAPVPPAPVRDLSSKIKEFAFHQECLMFHCCAELPNTYQVKSKERSDKRPAKGCALLLQLRADHSLLRDREQLYSCSCRHRDSFYSRSVHQLQELGGDQQFISYKTDTTAEQLYFPPQQFRLQAQGLKQTLKNHELPACYLLPAVNNKMPSELTEKPAVLQTDLQFHFSPPPISMTE